MKKRKQKSRQFKNTAYGQSAKPRTVEMTPEELAIYIRRAEQQVIPIIKKTHLPPGPAQLVLAQYTLTLVTGNSQSSLKSTMDIANHVLALWQNGIYHPGPEYPYTYEQTIRDLQGEQKAKPDYRSSLRPFTPTKKIGSHTGRQVAGGIVQHPETHLWQIWMITDGPCNYFGAYHDPNVAQKNLEAMIDAIRKRVMAGEINALSHKVSSQGEGQVKQIPFDMMEYLLKHIDQYKIPI